MRLCSPFLVWSLLVFIAAECPIKTIGSCPGCRQLEDLYGADCGDCRICLDCIEYHNAESLGGEFEEKDLNVEVMARKIFYSPAGNRLERISGLSGLDTTIPQCVTRCMRIKSCRGFVVRIDKFRPANEPVMKSCTFYRASNGQNIRIKTKYSRLYRTEAYVKTNLFEKQKRLISDRIKSRSYENYMKMCSEDGGHKILNFNDPCKGATNCLFGVKTDENGAHLVEENSNNCKCRTITEVLAGDDKVMAHVLSDIVITKSLACEMYEKSNAKNPKIDDCLGFKLAYSQDNKRWRHFVDPVSQKYIIPYDLDYDTYGGDKRENRSIWIRKIRERIAHMNKVFIEHEISVLLVNKSDMQAKGFTDGFKESCDNYETCFDKYITFQWAIENQAPIGAQLKNKDNIVKISLRAVQRPTMVEHEFLHILGFWHEHQRPDRDDHIIVHSENVSPNYEHNFTKFKKIKDMWANVDAPYDLSSIMHYAPNMGSTKKGYALELKDKNKKFDNQLDWLSKSAYEIGFSDGDIVQLRAAYAPPERKCFNEPDKEIGCETFLDEHSYDLCNDIFLIKLCSSTCEACKKIELCEHDPTAEGCFHMLQRDRMLSLVRYKLV